MRNSQFLLAPRRWTATINCRKMARSVKERGNDGHGEDRAGRESAKGSRVLRGRRGLCGRAVRTCCGGASPNPRFFFFNDTATTEIYTLSLHDALPPRGPPR